ncbi:MAG: alpha-glucoside-specific PTS transporter subunit IIBC [Atopostipes suicloacalis]|nr:alpha-glucoside-specific PTS transporter subunit IIBC [Atopostipes suicloacalis]MDN6731420.1 alpha-glucoside-specific PTS transporter subunit IIBC [Atopostipes suicloacalis]
MMKKIQRFGGAMIPPVLLFAFNGLILALSIAFQNESLIGSIAADGSLWTNMWGVIESAGWTLFNHKELLFVVGLPISLAKKAPARASLAAFTIYMTWNTYINAILKTFNFGIDVTDVDALGIKEISGISTLDTDLIGALLISGLAVFLHNRFYDKALPDWLGVFSGTSFVVIIGFIITLPLAYLTVIGWPPVQDMIFKLQDILAASGTFGVGGYVFLEKILLPTGLHHFVYQPFEFGPAAVEGGLLNYWYENLPEISAFEGSLREIIPEGGFMLQNAAKSFYPLGIGAAFVATSKAENRKKTLALVIPTAATAMLTAITEPFEFTFIFLAPALFLVHAILSSIFAMTIYALGVAGPAAANISGFANFMLPMFNNHKDSIFVYFVTGIVFIFIYFFIFRWAILKYDLKTPGREESGKVKMYSKKDYREKKENAGNSSPESSSPLSEKAHGFLVGLGGAENISDINNCTTRLRISVKDPDKIEEDAYFKEYGAHGVVRNKEAIQIIVGMDVPQVRDAFEEEVAEDKEE